MADLEEVLSRQLAEGQLTQEQYDRLMRKLQAKTHPRMQAAQAGAGAVAGSGQPAAAVQPDRSAIEHLNHLQVLADQLYRVGVAVYLALLIVGPLVLFLITPVRRWILAAQAQLVSWLTSDGTARLEAEVIAYGIAILVVGFFVHQAARAAFTELAPSLSRKHPVNTALEKSNLDGQAKSMAVYTLQARRASGWASLVAPGLVLYLAPGKQLRSFAVACLFALFAVSPTDGTLANPDGTVTAGGDRLLDGTNDPPGLAELYFGDPARGVERLRKAAAAGNASASALLSRMHFAGANVPRSDEEGVRLANAAIGQGHLETAGRLGNRLLWGFDVGKDQTRGLALVKQAVEPPSTPDGRMLFYMAQAYWFGGGIPVDKPAGARWFERATSQGYLAAHAHLGTFASENKRPSDAVNHWRLAATRAGVAEAQYALYVAYYDGSSGVPQDYALAREWLVRAARQGHSHAQAVLGYHYYVGKLVGRDDIESLRWSMRAAFRGSAVGMYYGALVLAKRWEATSNRASLKLAYLFYSLAAAKNYEDAREQRDRIAALLTPAEIADAQQTSREFEKQANAPSEMELTSTGTGFFSDVDLVVTNEHVISECAKIGVQTSNGISYDVLVAAANLDLDLAMLRVRADPQRTITTRIVTFAPAEPPLGERATAFGYPLTGLLASSGSLTTGTVTARAGIEDDATRLQFSTPVQPGNSGGALLDEHGRVIGVVQAGLNPISQGKETFVPQNVNFAVKGTELRAFLAANGYAPRINPGDKTTFDLKQLGVLAESFSARILCYRSGVESSIDQMRQRQ
jgi:TPR repeat protein